MRDRLFRTIGYVLVSAVLFQGSTAFALSPNDPLVSQQHHIDALNFRSVWDRETGDSSVVVAIIDSGVDTTHPDLRNNIWVNQGEIGGDGIDNDGNGYIDDIKGWDFVTNDADPSPDYSSACLNGGSCIAEGVHHGTIVAGVLAAQGNNGIGLTGVTWDAKIMSLRALDSSGIGDTIGVAEAVRYAIDNGADIINLSFVGPANDNRLHEAITDAYNAGLIVVTAVGNGDGSGNPVNLDVAPMYPVCYKNSVGDHLVVGVGSVDEFNRLSNFSNYGSKCLDLVAPGEDYIGTVVFDPAIESFNTYYDGLWNGTSLSAPIVSGVVALLKSKFPTLTNHQIIQLLYDSATDISHINPERATDLGYGLINPEGAFALAAGYSTESRLISGSTSAVYFLGSDGKRYVFPDELTYFSWFPDFSGVEQISDTELASYQLGGNVTIRPGTRLVKITSSPQVYAVASRGVLRWIETEEVATGLYGSNWAQQVRDIPDSFFFSYRIGDAIPDAQSFDIAQELINSPSINVDKGLR